MKKLFGCLVLSSLLLSTSVQAGEDYEGMAMIAISTLGGGALALSGVIGGGELGAAVSVAGLLSFVSGLGDLGKEYVAQIHQDTQAYLVTGEMSVTLEKFVELAQSKNPELSAEEIINQI